MPRGIKSGFAILGGYVWGFPHIPGQDTVIRYAAKGEDNAGAVL